MTIITIILYLLAVAVFITLSVIIFYHFARYSLIGDLSKRFFVGYVAAGAVVLLVGLIAIIINHLFNAS